MKNLSNQTIFITGKIAEVFGEIEIELKKQEKNLSNFVKNKSRPINDLWIAALSQAIGKIAKSVEDNNQKNTRNLIIKYIAQLLAWLELLDGDNEDLTLNTTKIHNPSFNTISVKLIGDLSREVLKNNNNDILLKISLIRSFCDQWIDRLKSTESELLHKKGYSVSLVKDYWHTGEANFEDIADLFSEVELNK
ncbi:MAG TPA: hypothetical protein VMZ29_10455 [Candidatus Bathyarchaeia archaeon]|nr:hypothetical protein [Candidatus Bathyarchaeia archaeon]